MDKFYYKLGSRRHLYSRYAAIFVVSIILSVSIISHGSLGYASRDPYDSGYDHGCDDARLDSSDRYINEPEKGPSFHTSTFMRGYNDGFNTCSGGELNEGQFSEFARPTSGPSSGGSSSINSGYSLTIQVTDWPFGSEDVKIHIETTNGYEDRKKISTAVPAPPSATFRIPPNQGNSVLVCTDPEGILAIGRCDSFTTNGQDTTIQISAR